MPVTKRQGTAPGQGVAETFSLDLRLESGTGVLLTDACLPVVTAARVETPKAARTGTLRKVDLLDFEA